MYVFVFTDLHDITIRKGVVPILGTYGCRIRIDSLNLDLVVPIECRNRKAMFLTYGRMTFRHQVTKIRRSGNERELGAQLYRKVRNWITAAHSPRVSACPRVWMFYFAVGCRGKFEPTS